MIVYTAFPKSSLLWPRLRIIFLGFHLIHPILNLNICKIIFDKKKLTCFRPLTESCENFSCIILSNVLNFLLLSNCRLQGMGFERGWGDTAERVLEMMHLLLDLLQAPDPSTLETFLGRVPMMFNVVILSPHGYFGQANVLGLPDTGGQVFLFITYYLIIFVLDI